MQTKQEIWQDLRENLEKFIALQDSPNATEERLKETRLAIEIGEMKLAALDRKAA